MAARALCSKGFEVHVFDERDKIGGIWGFDSERKYTSVWYNLNQNTPKGKYEAEGFPMPDHYPDFPSHQQVLAYLDDFVNRYDLRKCIHLNTRVESATRLPNGTWELDIGQQAPSYFDALVVANGHHNEPNFPKYSRLASFGGTEIHSKFYRYRHEYKDKNVLVVGIGNSGAQIAVDVSYDARKAYISTRRGVYILPHYLFGIRIDRVIGHSLDWWFKKALPHPLYGMLFTGLYNVFVGKHRQLNMPKPDHYLMSGSLPTLSENFANRVGDGKLAVVPEVSHLEPGKAILTNGESIEVDSIIYATGYQTTFPFLGKDVIDVKDNKVNLFLRMFSLKTPNIAFIGLFQAVTWGFLDMMDRQAELVADYFAGEYVLPTISYQMKSIRADRKSIEREFLHTIRNNYEMHGSTYLHELSLERRNGRVRATNSGSKSPLPTDANS